MIVRIELLLLFINVIHNIEVHNDHNGHMHYILKIIKTELNQ